MTTISDVKVLMNKKDELEVEIKELHDFLRDKGLGTTGGLVDNDGFPLSDVDKVISVREARGKLARLQNDHIALMKEIENAMVQVHSQAKSHRTETVSTKTNHSTSVEQEDLSRYDHVAKFARVADVTANSPAALARLKVDDEILEFGSIHSTNNNGLKAVGELVRDSENRQIQVVVRRRENEQVTTKILMLTPKKWDGRGLLGCHIVPSQ
ncbi:26S proteasome non-ATPase regulatory subunit 9-like [Planoprotostelium fungivorum]|uniref:26S proteasome non-ATPase regulatory subunit 9-like n=1 Tax=Planoprotostelium fungivorum TaxID=1890364 RepID=A0A2P6MN79_9EUKA|nr:26S proteasome non-ATPase regulatory subunit 9-like [Planoprotostelium fungivorum]